MGGHIFKRTVPLRSELKLGPVVTAKLSKLTTHADTSEDVNIFSPFTNTMTSNPIFAEQEHVASPATLGRIVHLLHQKYIYLSSC